MTRTAADKMRVKPGSRAHIVNGPAAVVAAMRLPELDLADDLVGEFDYLHLFVTAEGDMRQSFPRLAERLHLGGALWVSWPKGGRHGSDLNLKSVIRIGYDFGMVESTCLRVDEVWAALKFTHPKPGKTYCNSYGTLPRHATDRRSLVTRAWPEWWRAADPAFTSSPTTIATGWRNGYGAMSAAHATTSPLTNSR